MKKSLALLVLFFLLTIAPASAGAQYQTEEIVALIGNSAGDSVLVTLVDGHDLWVAEHPHDAAASYNARDTVCEVEQAIVTACGRYVYAAVSCSDWNPQMFVFEMRATFPCAQPTMIYIPLVQQER